MPAPGADVVTVEFGTRWELEAAGVVLDWSHGLPPRVAAGAPVRAPTGARARALLDAIARVKAALGDSGLVAASVTGPVAALALTASRALCEAGAGLIWLVEDGRRPPADAAALAPMLAAIRGHRAIPALHLSGPADAWLDAVKRLRQLVPCFDPAASPALAHELAGGRRRFGVLVAPGEPKHALAADPSCGLLVVHAA